MASSRADWKKKVTISPVQGITFIKDSSNEKPYFNLTLKNMSDQHVVFKIKTTNPNWYVVKPNMLVLRSGKETQASIIFNH